MSVWGVELAVMLVMVSVNSVFAGYEIALASVNRARLVRLVDEKRRGARAALHMKDNMAASLAVVQLGITLVGAVAAAVGGAGAEEKLTPHLMARFALTESTAEVVSILLVVVPLTVVTIIVGELIPKVFALRNAEWVTLLLSPFMRGFSVVVRPAVWFFETVVTGVTGLVERLMARGGGARPVADELQELRASAAMARAARLIGHREESIIVGAAEMRAHVVREIAVPIEHASVLEASATLADCLVAAHLDMHTRFPVVEDKRDRQSVIGYVNVKDIIATLHLSPKDPTLRAIVRAMPSFDADAKIAECLERMMGERAHIALVRDVEGRIIGMITLEDILEELVGDIEDEYDRLPTHIAPSGSGFVVGGGVALERLVEKTRVDLRALALHDGARTVSEWTERELAREPLGGDVVERGGVRLLVRKVRRHKVQEALVHREGAPTS